MNPTLTRRIDRVIAGIRGYDIDFDVKQVLDEIRDVDYDLDRELNGTRVGSRPRVAERVADLERCLNQDHDIADLTTHVARLHSRFRTLGRVLDFSASCKISSESEFSRTRDLVVQATKTLENITTRINVHAYGVDRDMVLVLERVRVAAVDVGLPSSLSDIRELVVSHAKKQGRALDLNGISKLDNALRRSEVRDQLWERLSSERESDDPPIAIPATTKWLSQWLVAVAVCTLPTDHRSRYVEEFRAELSELQRRRLPYATRLAVRSFSLRASLMSTDATRAGGR